jgi:hypothetical protein
MPPEAVADVLRANHGLVDVESQAV